VFDCADDWSAILGGQRALLQTLYARVAREADAVIVGAPALAQLFERESVAVVANGTPSEMLATEPAPAPKELALVYAGTLSERFDTDLVADVLERLQNWRLDLYGECRYRGSGLAPARELQALMQRFSDRLRWHGPVERRHLRHYLDAGRILVLPHRKIGAVTGDAMKLYDYAARGRPIVSTDWGPSLRELGLPHLYLADAAEGWVAAIEHAAQEPAAYPADRRKWAETNRWSDRWPTWAAAAFPS
jgi:glycosyltransferase involved in cell wall biosynthesis